MPLERWQRALRSGTRANVALNAALRVLSLFGLAGLWLSEAPDPGTRALLAGATAGVLIAGLSFVLGRSERFMQVWHERTFFVRFVVAVVLASGFVVAAEHALGPAVVAAAVALTLSSLYHVALWMREDF